MSPAACNAAPIQEERSDASPNKRKRRGKGARQKGVLLYRARRETDRELRDTSFTQADRKKHARQTEPRDMRHVFNSAAVSKAPVDAPKHLPHTKPGFTGLPAPSLLAHSLRLAETQEIEGFAKCNNPSSHASANVPLTAPASRTTVEECLSDMDISDSDDDDDMDISEDESPHHAPDHPSSCNATSASAPDLCLTPEMIKEILLKSNIRAAPQLSASSLDSDCDPEVRHLVEKEGYKYLRRDNTYEFSYPSFMVALTC